VPDTVSAIKHQILFIIYQNKNTVNIIYYITIVEPKLKYFDIYDIDFDIYTMVFYSFVERRLQSKN
jgi:hypothetical protein